MECLVGCALMRRFSALEQEVLVLVLEVTVVLVLVRVLVESGKVTVVLVQVPPAVSEERPLAVSRRRLWHLLCAEARAVRLSVFSCAGLQQHCAVQRAWRHARVHVLCANLGIQTCHRLPCLQTPLRREGLAAMWMGRGLCNSLSLAARWMWSSARRERRGRTVRGGLKVVFVGRHPR